VNGIHISHMLSGNEFYTEEPNTVSGKLMNKKISYVVEERKMQTYHKKKTLCCIICSSSKQMLEHKINYDIH